MDKSKIIIRGLQSIAGILALVASSMAWAALTDLATVPLATSSNTVVRPNILFTLDNSGSMAWDYLPDYAGGGMGTSYPHCKTNQTCSNGLPPFQAGAYNGLAYNPALTYGPPVNFDGTLKPSQNATNTTNWTAVKNDGYGVQSTGTTNLTTGYLEVVYCNGSVCKQNGIDTNNPFFEDATGTANPPNYAFPGSAYSYGTISSVTTLFNGTLNGATYSSSTLFSGTLNNASTSTYNITLTISALNLSGSKVTLNYSSQSPTAPLIATGDTITVSTASSGSCSSAWKVSGASINVSAAGTLTYSAVGSKTANTSCTAVVTHTVTPVVPAPSIASDNTTVTVILNSLVDSTGHTLAVGDVIQVTGAGCDAGYQATNAIVKSVNTTTQTFTYAAQLGLGTPSNTSCNIARTIVTLPAAPGISINGNVVTVSLTAHGLVTGDVVQVTGAGCGSAFTTGTVPGQGVTVINANTFTYNGILGGSMGTVCQISKVTFLTPPTLLSFTSATNHNGNPYEYVIVPVEFCDSPYLTNCVASSVPTTVASVSYSFPAPVRFCNSAATAALPPCAAGAQTGSSGTITCQALFSTVTGIVYTSVRYGLFYRVDVLPTRPTYGNEVLNGTINANGTNITFNNVKVVDHSARTDCAASPNCTYAEEMTNFANYYAYYQTRIQMMKTSAGMAFQPMDTRYRIGFATINESWAVPTTTTGGQWLPIGMFDVTQKQKWYNAMYSINPNSSTPLREAVARAGRYFAGLHGLPGDATHMTDDPMEYSCQQNFLLITTDGYWNGTDSSVVDLKGVTITNTDNGNSGMTARSLGVYDGGISYSPTLADTAEYYYQTDLRTAALGNCTSGASTGATLCTTPAVSPDPLDNVPASTKDQTAVSTSGTGLMWQHMVTFSLGLSNGLMLYQPNYETASTGDFSSIKSAATGCPFSGSGTCNWPLPVADSPTALDDLWHGAVNGRGTFYNARDPVSLSKGLSGALAGMNVTTGAAAASATSSPNITQTDRSIFSSTYRTVFWDGEVVAQLLNPATGNVPPASLTALTGTLSSISFSGSTVAVNMIGHGLSSGDLIQVANASTGTCDPAFNTGGQSLQVTVVDANNFTYSSLNAAGATVNTQCQIFKAGIAWSAQKQLDIKVAAAAGDPQIGTRFIFTDDTSQLMPLNTTNSALPMNGLKYFDYNLMPAADQALFNNQCTTTGGVTVMSQCTTANLTAAQINSANLGLNLVQYLRGNQTLEQTVPNASYRPRQHFLGDTVNARPAYVRAPLFGFTDTAWLANNLYHAGDTFSNAGVSYVVNTTYTSGGVFGGLDTAKSEVMVQNYGQFQAANQGRPASLYIAANEGMLHSFDAGQCTQNPVACTTGTGNERWAYVPHETLSNLWKLADVNYGSNHQFFVDGSPEVMDIYVNNAYSTASGLAVGWHTILVGGLNGGGRGYYALDITDPLVPIGLWDICASSTLCTFVDSDMGYSYGNPVITKRSTDGRWVVLVSSGYNNVSPGTGQGYLYVLDAITGTILSKIPTGSGSTTAPSGLAKISAWGDNANVNNTARFVYSGDLNGDVWRFDLGAPGSIPTAYPTLSAPAMRFTTLYSDAAGTMPQPITTRPELGDVWPVAGSISSLQGVGKPAIFIATGKYLGASDLSNLQVQTVYALKDDFSIAGPTFPLVPAITNPRNPPRVDMVVQTINTSTGTSSNNTVNWTVNEGWYADFPDTGERNNLDPQLVLGTLIVVSNTPQNNACVTGGVSHMYQFNFKNGNNVTGAAGGAVRTTVASAISVGFVAVRLPSGQLKVIVTSASGAKTSEGVNVSGTAATRNVSWRELLQ